MDELRDLTETLVPMPSYENETAVGDVIEAWLREETDANVTRDDTGNVVARVNPGVGESLVLVSHYDVAPPADRQTTDSGDYIVETRDGCLCGRGAAGMKGAIAASMLAFRGAAVNVGSEVAFAPFIGEEIGGEDVRAALDNGSGLDYAVVVEGSMSYPGLNRADAAIVHRGCRASTLAVSETTRHASEPERGENAVYRTTDVMDVAHGLSVPDVEVFDYPASGSIAVIEIDGGNARNVIPDRCEVTLDERIVLGGFADLARTAELEGVERVVEQDPPLMACDDADFVERVLNVVRSVREACNDAEPEQTTKPHTANAGWLAQAGTTCAVYGPSEPGGTHMKDENVSFDMLVQCYETYRVLAANW